MNSKQNHSLLVQRLGNIHYKDAWDFQTMKFQEILDIKLNNRTLDDLAQEITPNYLYICQHPHVYTIGKTGKEAHLLVNNEFLKKENIEFFQTNRGGDITYHGPGQMVAYPVMDLENFFTDIHKYMRSLEESVIRTLADYGITAGRHGGFTGVWIDVDSPMPRKICAMGVRTSRWVAMHGLALNVFTDLNYFKNIVPCGIDNKPVTSIEKELGKKPDMEEVETRFINHFKKVFEAEVIS